jgi:peptide-methionine (S)-S-oxide reductase
MRRFLIAGVLGLMFNPAAAVAKTETAVFAGGCFWCVEKDMDKLKGVASTISGFAGGNQKNPTYKSHKGSVEAVQIEFDPAVISYDSLVARFLRSIDVTDAGGQFCDRGAEYTSAIFTATTEQNASAEKAVQDAEAQLGRKIVTPVKKFSGFTPAEDYHQNYYLGQNRILTRFGYVKQADAYERYRKSCGRDKQVRKIWGAAAYGAGS